jgi:NADPH:quinone reductase
MGTAAEYIALNADLVTELPAHVSFAEGVTIGVPCMTAHCCVFVGGHRAGAHAAGDQRRGRGRPLRGAACQMGGCNGDRHRHFGGEGRARAGETDAVINYRQEDVAARVRAITSGAGIDHIVDVEFGGNLAATLGCVCANSSIAIYASNGDRTPRVPVGELMQRNVSLYPMSLPGTPHAARKRA